MADSNTSLPVRTQNNGDVVVNIADGTVESQKLAVDTSGRITTKMDDGTGNPITSQSNGAQRALDVGIDVAGVQVDPRAIRALTAADIVTANQGTANTSANAWPVKITDGTNVAGVAPASTAATTTQPAEVVALSPNSPIPAGTNNIGKIELTDGTNVVGVAPASTAASATEPAAVVALSPNSPTPAGTNIIGKIEITDGTNVGGVTAASAAAIATQPAQVVALSPNSPVPAGTNAIGSVLANIQVANAPVTIANPVPVTITTASAGTPIQSYQTSSAVAVGSTVTLTYTVPASHTFSLERVWVTASGKIKAVVQNGTTTIFAAFNSTANPNIDLTVTAPPTLAAASTVNVLITNNDLLAFDVYATIEGNQIT